jgi:hypothetical protein
MHWIYLYVSATSSCAVPQATLYIHTYMCTVNKSPPNSDVDNGGAELTAMGSRTVSYSAPLFPDRIIIFFNSGTGYKGTVPLPPLIKGYGY